MTPKIKKKSLLIVETETELISSLKELLEAVDFEVTILEDLRQIFQLFEAHQFDVVLSHWNDPYLSVEAVFDEARFKHPKTKFVVMTGAFDVGEDFEKKYSVIYKPFRIEDLNKILKSP